MKTIAFLLFLLANVNIFTQNIIKFADVKNTAGTIPTSDLKNYIAKIKNKKLNSETGWILYTENYNETSDIVYIEMDKPDKNFSLNKPDLYFIIDKKISKKLFEYQMIYFNASIKDYDFDKKLFVISDVFLNGIMK